MAKEREQIAMLDVLINGQDKESINRDTARRLAVGFNDGSNKMTYRIDPTYASILGPTFNVFYNMSRIAVFCDGIEREITKEHYQALQTYLQWQREQIRSRSTKVNFAGRTEVGDFRKIQ